MLTVKYLKRRRKTSALKAFENAKPQESIPMSYGKEREKNDKEMKCLHTHSSKWNFAIHIDSYISWLVHFWANFWHQQKNRNDQSVNEMILVDIRGKS